MTAICGNDGVWCWFTRCLFGMYHAMNLRFPSVVLGCRLSSRVCESPLDHWQSNSSFSVRAYQAVVIV